MKNATQLKMALKYLGMTGVDLANKLSQHREDGRRTAPETVSRWLSGNVSIDPGVMAWIDQSVRIKAVEHVSPMITLPSHKKSLVIGFANLYSAFGPSVQALQVSALIHTQYKHPVSHICLESDPHTGMIMEHLDRLWIPCDTLSELDLGGNLHQENRITVVDLGAKVWDSLRSERPHPSLRDIDVDMLLMPIDLNNVAHLAFAETVLNTSGLREKIRIVHSPAQIDMRFINTCKEEKINLDASFFTQMILRSPTESKVDVPDRPCGEWADSTHKINAERILAYVMDEMGGQLLHAQASLGRIETIPLPELLQEVWQAEKLAL